MGRTVTRGLIQRANPVDGGRTLSDRDADLTETLPRWWQIGRDLRPDSFGDLASDG